MQQAQLRDKLKIRECDQCFPPSLKARIIHGKAPSSRCGWLAKIHLYDDLGINFVG